VCSPGHGLKIATSTYYAAKNRAPSTRAVRDAERKAQISRIHADHLSVYGVRRVWRQLHREGIPVARCTVARLMRELGLQGAPAREEDTTRRLRPTTQHPVCRGLPSCSNGARHSVLPRP
jgi:transposase InsO family protein